MARDRSTGEIGAAVQSKFPGVGTIALHGRADAGCVVTQAFANPLHGDQGIALMALGADPGQALAILLRQDEAEAQRQIALIDASNPLAWHTGEAVRSWDGWAGSAAGEDCLAMGNTLAGQHVVAAMVTGFRDRAGDLTDRLIAGLRAGRDAGGELRGQQSGAVLVVKPSGGYGGRSGRHVDICVYDHPEPIEELARCFTLHRLSYFPSDPEKLVPIDASIARPLKTLLRQQGHRVSDGAAWRRDDIAALKRFMGVENYDNRLRDDDRIDLDVLEDLKQRYPDAFA
ncbi:MAG: DUF1028 domain-containing protein [Rhodothalassiaceae bacterium]